jgi:hypothetical protein
MTASLFVPLKRQPFEAFAAGTKRWEIRRNEGQWLKAQPGMAARLRLGYSGNGELRRIVGRLVIAMDAARLWDEVPWWHTIPWAKGPEHAAELVRVMLQGKPEHQAAGLVAIEMLET